MSWPYAFDFVCAGETPAGAAAGRAHWPARRLLAVADLHLEKGSSYAVAARKLLPRHDTRQTLAALAALIDALAARRPSSAWAIPSTTARPSSAWPTRSAARSSA